MIKFSDQQLAVNRFSFNFCRVYSKAALCRAVKGLFPPRTVRVLSITVLSFTLWRRLAKPAFNRPILDGVR